MNKARGNNPKNSNRTLLHTIVPRRLPFAIGIAPSDACNFRCKYCAHSVPGGMPDARIMTWKDFLLLADQIEELLEHANSKENLSSGGVRNVRFCGTGEPMLNKNLPEMIAHLAKRDISDRYEVTSNGSLLTHEMADRLSESGITRLLISVQGVTKEAYLETCQVPIEMELFLEQLAYFYRHRKKCKVYIKIIDVALKDKSEEDSFYKMFSPVADAVNVEHMVPTFEAVDYDRLRDYNGSDRAESRYGLPLEKHKVCEYLFQYLNISALGKVDSCGCTYPPLWYGNIHDERLVDIWNGEAHKGLMKTHLRMQKDTIPRCRECPAANVGAYPEDLLDSHAQEVLARVEQI